VAEYHLAQLNIAKMRFPLEADEMAGFVARLEDINALADRAPGFVWRLQTEDGDAIAIDLFGADVLVNLSLWSDIDSLRAFAFRSAHREVLCRRREWFETIGEAYAVLWRVAAGHVPTVEEAAERLDSLRSDGPGRRAFTFGRTFAPG
jgi:hypothetical protein